MLPFQFIATDIHFVIAILAATATLATAWLYLDIWIQNRRINELLKWLGFGFLGIGLLARATEIEPIFLDSPILNYTGAISLVLRSVGYVGLIIGISLDRVEPTPATKSILNIWVSQVTNQPSLADQSSNPYPKLRAYSPVFFTIVSLVAALAGGGYGLPLLAGIVCYLYWRRAFRGLERHLKRVGWAFLWFTAFELASLGRHWSNSTDPRVYNLLAPFGPVWVATQVLLLIGAFILGRWITQYLTKRIQTQLFMVILGASIMIFLITTVSFTFLLMNRMQIAATKSLATTSKVLRYAIDSKLAETTANTEIVAHDPAIIAAVAARNHAQLATLLATFLADKKQTTIVITSESGQVLLRGHDPARWGDSLSSDTLVNRALVGQTSSGLVATSVSNTPNLIIKTTTPIRQNGLIIGTVSVGLAADNAFVDGIHQTSGLSAAVFSGSTQVATTILGGDNRTRITGSKETNSAITNAILNHNQTWSGTTNINGIPYLAVYTPLVDADKTPVGMLLIGQPQTDLFQAAGWAIEITFLVAIGLLLLSVVPLGFTAHSLAKQLD